MPRVEAATAEVAGFMTLDVIGDPIATRNNYEALLDVGLRPIPIITRGASQADIDRYYETSDYVAFGGIRSSSGSRNVIRWLMRDMPKGKRVHWLGFTNHNYMCYYKPASVDSSSWSASCRYGVIDIYQGNGTFVRRRRRHLRLSASERQILTRMGFDPERLKDSHRRVSNANERSASIADCVSIQSYINYTREIEARTGTRYYFVYSNNHKLTAQMLQLAAERPCIGNVNTVEMRTFVTSGNLERWCKHN